MYYCILMACTNEKCVMAVTYFPKEALGCLESMVLQLALVNPTRLRIP